MDSDGEYCGMIETDALEGDVEAVWKRVLITGVSEEDKAAIKHYQMWDNNYCDWVVAILQYSDYKASRIIATEIYS